MSNTNPFTTQASLSATGPPEPHNGRRSSSLSELADAVAHENPDSMIFEDDDDPDGNETEAETERLEDSPFKRQKHQNVVLASGDVGSIVQASPEVHILRRDKSQSLSGTSSPAHSSEDEKQECSSLPSPKKRKHSHLAEESDIGIGLAHSSPFGGSPLSSSLSSKSPRSPHLQPTEHRASRDPSESDSADISQTPGENLIPNTTNHTGDDTIEDEAPGRDNILDIPEANVDRPDVGDAPDSNGDDIEGDDTGDVELENANKSQEELDKKRSALDSLTALEKCFATLRDKLFDERLAAANEELSLLQRPDFVHPDLLAMKDAVDRHREQKIKYQQTFLKYKLETLQRESVATKHQIQSQYMQTVRELRDRSLDELNKEFYQVQRERRCGDDDVPDPMYLFSNNRTQQITQQMAYNNEVSILSGVAKHVGFPAAPAIRTARPSELEEDLRIMGIPAQPNRTLQHRLPSFKTHLTGPEATKRQTPTAEENFLERNAWANPHHPAHQQRLQMHRPVSQTSQRQRHQSTTPVVKRSGGETGRPPASTLAVHEHPSENFPSKHTTPMPTDHLSTGVANSHDSSTRRQVVEDDGATGQQAAFKNTKPRQSNPAQSRPSAINSPPPQASSSLARHGPNRDSTSGAMPKPLPFAQNTGSRISPPVRLPVKIEDGQARQPSSNHKFGSPAPAITAGNGQLR